MDTFAVKLDRQELAEETMSEMKRIRDIARKHLADRIILDSYTNSDGVARYVATAAGPEGDIINLYFGSDKGKYDRLVAFWRRVLKVS